MRRNFLVRVVCSVALLGLSLALVPLRMRAASELEQHLSDQYVHKTLILRNFYDGERLNCDAAGAPVAGSGVPGDWTLDGFVRVASLSLSDRRLSIQAERLSLGNDGQNFQFQHSGKDKKNKKGNEKIEKEQRLSIEIEFDAGGITAEKADAALSRIFLTTQDRFAEVVPSYWKGCVLAASTGKGKGPYKYDACGFPREFAAIPGIRYTPEEKKKVENGIGEPQGAERPAFHIGKGVSAPRVISQASPAFSGQASREKYQGRVLLSLVVDETGKTRNIEILQPLGMGLDQKAVESVAAWKFKPGVKDGQPVAVALAVEVDFHLY